MDQNAPGIAKKIWHMVRVAFFMLKKGICKRKILLDLNIMIKRGKLAGKSLHNLMSHHHHHHHHSATDLQYAATASAAPDQYEFSCSSTPLHRRYFNKTKKSPHPDAETVSKAVEIMNLMMMSSNNNDDVAANSSPLLPGLGFGRSPAARQLRITDSPFPLQNNPDEDGRVDQAAEDFINNFYSQLKQQKNY